MKILLLNNIATSMARGQLAEATLAIAAKKLDWDRVTTPNEAELIIVIGKQIPINLDIHHKRLLLVEQLSDIFANAELFLMNAKTQAQYYEAPITENEPLPSMDEPAIIKLLAVTACPTGVAHTFMAAEAIEQEAKRRGWPCIVETRGSVGAGNVINAEEIAEADLVIIAADIDVDIAKFAGKRMYRTSTGMALKKTAEVFDHALAEATIYQPDHLATTNNKTATAQSKKSSIYGHLLTGVSYMLPMVVAGGLLIALSLAMEATQLTVLTKALKDIGQAAFHLMIPILAGYIAFSVADRPGLVPGMIAGLLATNLQAGFLGGIVGGYLAGYIALLLIKGIKLPKNLNALKPILIIPLLSTLICGLIMLFVIGQPVADAMEWLTRWLNGLGSGNAIIFGALLGGMMCIDMGGPINKVAYAFGVGLLGSGQGLPMAAIMAGGMVPPIAIGIASLLARPKFNQSERDGGLAAFVLGLCFISEGAIPFAARDPFRVLPISALGGAIAGGLSMYFGVHLMAPHGGLFVLAIPGAIDHVMRYLIAISSGAIISAVIYATLKPTIASDTHQATNS